MNIQGNRKYGKIDEDTTKLYENAPEQTPQSQITPAQKASMENVFIAKSKQIEFSNGVIMGNFNVDTGNAFCLKHHFDQTQSQAEFVNSVIKYVGSTGSNLSVADITKLENEYNKYKKML